MFFVYGAYESKACDRAEFMLHMVGHEYRFYSFGIHYTLAQLQRLVPGAQTVPQIFHGTKYIGGINELVRYLQGLQESENSSGRRTIGTVSNKGVFNIFLENEPDTSNDTPKE